MDIPEMGITSDEYKSLDRRLAEITNGPPAGIPTLAKNLLYTFPAARMASSGRPGRIHCEYEELTAICPWTDMPDQGKLYLDYTPVANILELKSFKYYLLAFRVAKITQEHLCQLIYEDLAAVLKPDFMRIELDYWPRGGIHTTFYVDTVESAMDSLRRFANPIHS